MSEEAFLWVAVLGECAAVAFRLRRLAARPHDGAERAHLGIYVFGVLGLAPILTPVYAAVDRQLGVPNVALLFAAVLLFVSAWCVQVFYLFVTRPGRDLRAEIGRRVWLLAGGCALQAVLFWLADAHEEANSIIGFRERYGQEPAVQGLGAVIFAWSALVFWSIAQLTRHYAALSRRPTSRLGLYLSVTGALLGIANAVHNELDLLFQWLGWLYPFDPPDALSHALIAGAVLLLVAGNTMPVWGRRLGLAAALRWLADYRAYLAIRPLWRDLCRAVPEVALEPPPGDRVVQDSLPPRDLRFRLYRCLVEVLDARLLLRAYLDPRVLELAIDAWHGRGRSASPELPVFLEAVALEAALRARAADRPPARPGTLLAIPANGGMSDELDFFCRVAHQRARSALLRQVVTRLATEAGHATEPSSLAHVSDDERPIVG